MMECLSVREYSKDEASPKARQPAGCWRGQTSARNVSEPEVSVTLECRW